MVKGYKTEFLFCHTVYTASCQMVGHTGTDRKFHCFEETLLSCFNMVCSFGGYSDVLFFVDVDLLCIIGGFYEKDNHCFCSHRLQWDGH